MQPDAHVWTYTYKRELIVTRSDSKIFKKNNIDWISIQYMKEEVKRMQELIDIHSDIRFEDDLITLVEDFTHDVYNGKNIQQKEYTHPKERTYQPYQNIKANPKEKTYKDYFEFCVKETWMQFTYPKDRDKIQDWTVDWDVIVNDLNTDDNLKVLEKIKENIWIDWVIALGIDNKWCIICADLRSNIIWFIGGYEGICDYSIIPSTE